MVKKLLPIIFIFFVWFIFSKPYLIDKKIPLPSDYQVNQFELWNVHEKYWSPIKNPLISDVISELYPWKKFTIESIKSGQIPYWNPYSFSGTPHLADYQSSVFSITNLFYFIFNFKDAWSLSVIIQPLLAGIFMYFFIKSLKLNEFSSVVGAVSFMFCGIITTWMNWTTISLAISFLPLALFAIEKHTSNKQYRFLVILAVAFPLSFFSGHFQISFYFMIYVLSYIIFKLFETKDKSAFLNYILFSFLGILLSMPQILPSIELYLQAFRSSIFQKINSVPISHLPTIIAPDFYGNPVSRNNFMGTYAEKSSFAGTIPVMLAIYSAFAKSKKVTFFFIMALVSLLFCLDTPILDIIVQARIPVISTSSLSRILVLFSFSISVLAAFGLNQLTNDIVEKKYKKVSIWSLIIISIISLLWILVLGKMIDPRFYSIAARNLILPSIMIFSLIILAFCAFLNRRIFNIAFMLIVFLVAFDMLRFSTKWQPFTSKDLAFPETPIISELSKLDKNYRFLGSFGAEGSVYYKLPSTEGYDPLYINRYGEFIGSLNNGSISPSGRVGVKLPTRAKYFPKVMDFLGIKYVLVKKKDIKEPWSFPLNNFPKNKFEPIYQEKDFQIYENKEAYPRAYLVGDYVVSKNNQEIVNKIIDENFDLRKNVVLEENPKIERVGEISGSAKIKEYKPNKIIVETNSDNNSILVLSDNFYPGWHAKINGSEGNILRANYTFRAVPLPKGKNTVEFYFKSKSFNWGVILAVVSLFSIFIIIAGKWYTNSKWIKRNKTAKSAIKSHAETVTGKQTKKNLKK